KSDWYVNFVKDFENYSNFYNENFYPELRDKFNSLIERNIEIVENVFDTLYEIPNKGLRLKNKLF
uniref:hypothetical protein n=1 Tax=Arcobacter sp. TaxID=1872629 RepID=UPI003D0F6BB4